MRSQHGGLKILGIVSVLTITVSFGLAMAGIYGYVSHRVKPSTIAKIQQSNTEETRANSWTRRTIATFRADGYHFQLNYPDNFFEAGYEPVAGSASCLDSYITDCPTLNAAVPSHDGLPEAKGKKEVINGTDYCHYQLTDAAAGSRYYYEYYWTARNKQCSSLMFITSEQDCANYLPITPENEEQEKKYDNCTAQNKARPSILQQIISTLVFTNN